MKWANKIRAARGQAVMIALWTLRGSARMLRMMPAYRRFVARRIKGLGLFDRAYYLEVNADVAAEGVAPEYHYVAYGDRENRQPMAFFDPGHYRSQTPGKLARINSLLHYRLIGRYRGISPSPWFDISYYLANNKDVARSGVDPLYHYLRVGGPEGRSPSQQFDGAYYLRANPDVAVEGHHPLLHYLKYGRLESRPTRMEDLSAGEPEAMPVSVLPSESDWDGCNSGKGGASAKVDIIVPVYKGRAQTLRCLLSVLKSTNETPFELIVINDASPDADLVEDLVRLAEQGLFTLLHNRKNLGFVATVNRGMRLHLERDKLLLNSDTEVYNDWLDRLAAAAYRNPLTGTVTPLSNNATICSYPHFLHDNPYPLEVPYHELDRLTADANARVEVEAPTGVGFCMYIRHACLQAIGRLDEKSFPYGYGEENDFCQRAITKGWRNVISADVFVRHLGAVSFQGEKGKHLARAMSTLERLHPNYHQDVRRFITADPLASARARLDWARLKAGVKGRNILMVCHNRGGGAERHLQEDAQREIEAGRGVFYLRPQRGDPSRVRLYGFWGTNLPNMPGFRLSDTSGLAGRLNELSISRIQNHGMVDFEPQAPLELLALASAAGIPYFFDIHDYKVICPRINLVDKNGRYCGEPNEDGCDRCLRTAGNDFGVGSIRQWRNLHHRALLGARDVFVPDHDVAQRLARYFPDVTFTVSPHETVDSRPKPMRSPIVGLGQPLKIVVIGAIGKIKGYDVLHGCASDAKARGLPLDFTLMGYSLNDRALSRAGVSVTGRYLDIEAEAILSEIAPHVVWLPSLWPETYSYTLSLALAFGYPIVAFDLGAIAQRLRRLERGQFLMPLHLIGNNAQINERFMRLINGNGDIEVKEEVKLQEDAS